MRYSRPKMLRFFETPCTLWGKATKTERLYLRLVIPMFCSKREIRIYCVVEK